MKSAKPNATVVAPIAATRHMRATSRLREPYAPAATESPNTESRPLTQVPGLGSLLRSEGLLGDDRQGQAGYGPHPAPTWAARRARAATGTSSGNCSREASRTAVRWWH